MKSGQWWVSALVWSPQHRSDDLDSLQNCLPFTLDVYCFWLPLHKWNEFCIKKWSLSQLANKPNYRLMSVAFSVNIKPNNGLLQWDVAPQRIISFKDCQIFAVMHSHSASSWSDDTSTPNATGTAFRCAAVGREQHREQVDQHILSFYS